MTSDTGAPSEAPLDIADFVEALLPIATPGALGALILDGDPQADKLTPARRRDLVRVALKDGRDEADRVARHWGRELGPIAARLDVAVTDEDEGESWGTVKTFADYRARPPCVRLYRRALDPLDRSLAQPRLREILDLDRAGPDGEGLSSVALPFLAHEIYHHLDTLRPTPLARRHKVTLFELPFWRWTSGIVTLSEIAAGAFAQRLLGLSFHAKLFDLIALAELAPATARLFQQRLQAAAA